MSTEFRFDETRSLADNFAAFLAVLDGIDKEMAAILRANAPALAAIVRDGERDASARAAFNAAIAAALDSLAAPKAEPESA
jgi:hypothetical protein